jgi:DNA polymerase-3 subunit gamma/tau
MAYQVLARKWRPQNFTQLVGQEHVSQSLANALRHDRLHHAYLFTGTRGVGKTTVARIFAKAMNCESLRESNPCGECGVCRAFDEGRFLDLIEVDAASRTKVEDTRDLLDNAQYAPNQGRYKIYLIDEVHMLSGHSFNALLKTLEEPPPHVKFLLATTDPQKIPVTVLSRCLQFNLKRLLPEQIDAQMAFILGQEKIEFESAALKQLARAADGSLRDGLSLLDQAIAFGNGLVRLETVNNMLGTVAQQPVDEILLALANDDAVGVLQKIADMSELTPDFSEILQQILRVLHRVALTQAVSNAVDSHFEPDTINQLAESLSSEDTQLFYQIALIGQRDLDLAPDRRSGFEMIMLRMLAFKPDNGKARVASPAIAVKVGGMQAKERIPSISASSIEHQVKEPAPKLLKAGDNKWAEMVVAMKVGGMTRELANNCVLESIDDKDCYLSLTPGRTQLISPRAQEKLQQALRQYCAQPVKLHIKAEESVAITPAQQITKKRENIQQAAVDSINEDENVQVLKENFDARVMPGTIEPISDNK